MTAKKTIKPDPSIQRLFSFFEEPHENGRTVRHQSRAAVTFKGGLDQLAHRWFRLTPSFSPQLVSRLLAEFAKPDATVLDPFAGRGTTLIECQLQNVASIGVELNPLLRFAADVSLNWNIPHAEASSSYDRIRRLAEKTRKGQQQEEPEQVAEGLGVGFPLIHNVYRWWRKDVLRDLLILKYSIRESCNTPELRNLFFLALANILLDTANITLGRLQLHFVNRAHEDIHAFDLFSVAGRTVLDDLAELNTIPVDHPAKLYLGDSRQLMSLLEQSAANIVITSPPYPNRYSYVWNTRPHLYFLDVFTTAREAAALDCNTIGGTWGTATSRHLKGEYCFSDPVVESVAGLIVNEIRSKDLLMSNYVAMYFDDLFKHIVQLRQCLSEKSVCAYVVGNSRIKKSIVQTDVLLSSLFQSQGFRQIRLEEIRRRNSGKELHETIVLVQKD